jgi:hypothetical protein
VDGVHLAFLLRLNSRILKGLEENGSRTDWAKLYPEEE